MSGYLVKGESASACCTDPVAGEYAGFHEVWRSDGPKHPGVWSMSEDSQERVSASDAQSTGCNAPHRQIMIADLKKFLQSAAKYYPDLIASEVDR